MHFLLTIMLLTTLDCVVKSREIWISWRGRDQVGCGTTLGGACRTISHVLSSRADIDVINLDGTRPEFLYRLCQSLSNPFVVTSSFNVTGVGGIPTIGCPKQYQQHTIFTLKGTLDNAPKAVFQRVRFKNGIIYFSDAILVFQRAMMINATFKSLPICNEVDLVLQNSYFAKYQVCETDSFCNVVKDFEVVCQNVKALISQSQFYDTNLMINAEWSADIVIQDSIFKKNLQQETGIGGANITLPNYDGSLLVTNCTFAEQMHHDPIFSAINIEAAALRIDARPSRNHTTNATVIIRDTDFLGNERGLSITSGFRMIRLRRCRFIDNKALHAAAGIRLALSIYTKVVIFDSIFHHNAAGHNRYKSIPGRFDIDNDQVIINNKLIKGVIALVGKGGAVRIHQGIVVFINCSFVNNTAKLLGGSIFVDRIGIVNIIQSQFENSHSHRHSLQGDLIYSTGKVKIRECRFDIQTSVNHISILRHSGQHWSMDVQSMWFQCPMGNKLLIINTTSYMIKHNVGLISSHKLDQMYYFCQTCDNNQYSLDYGYINYTLTDNTIEYYTLFINGEQPFKSHSVNFVYGNITCHDCPYGADCENDIHAIANFWGYKTGNVMLFQHCPDDYCCSTPTCPVSDACAEHRIGRLCGRCKAEYSEALFSSKCVPTANCHSYWVVPFTLSMGVLYALFLVFQTDLRDMFSSWIADSNPCLCCKRQEPYVITYVPPKSRNSHGSNGPSCHLATRVTTKTTAEHSRESTSTKLGPSSEGAEAGCLITLFYYFQDALLLHVNTVYTKTVSKLEKQLRAFILGLFRFRLDFYQFLDNICLFPSMHPVSKLLFKTLFVPYLLLLFGLFYCLYKWHRVFQKRGLPPRRPAADEDFKANEKTFSTRLTGGFILAFLFTYQKLATATFTLLNCVPVAGVHVLFIDGTVTCYESWQYGVMVYAFASVLLFSLILMVGPPLLKRQEISLGQFFFGCLCPLPALVWWLTRHCIGSKKRYKKTAETLTLINILQGPFNDSKSKKLIGQLCWAGVLMGRRVILFLCFTFINDVLVRLLCMLSVCFVILMHHMYIKPYKSPKGNLAGAFSAGALLIVGAINLVRAGFEAAEYVPQGPYRYLMEVCEEIENTLILWLPLVGMCIIILILVAKFIFVVLKYVFKVGRCTEHNEEEIEVETRLAP